MFQFLSNSFISDTAIRNALMAEKIVDIQAFIEKGINISRVSNIAKKINAKELPAPNRVKLMRIMLENDHPLESSIFSNNKNLFEEFITTLPDVTQDNAQLFAEETKQFFLVLKTKIFNFRRMSKRVYDEELAPEVNLLLKAVIALISGADFDKISSFALQTIIRFAQERLPEDDQDILDALMKHDNLNYVEIFNKTDKGLFFSPITLYHNAARIGCPKILRGMYEQGITRYVNYAVMGDTPLVIAIYFQHKEVVIELLAQGAEPSRLYGSTHRNTVTLAAGLGCIDILDVFLNHLGKEEFCNQCSDDFNLFYDLLKEDKPEVFLYLLNLGLSCNARHAEDALSKGYDNLVREILKKQPECAASFNFRKKCCKLGRLDFFQQALSINASCPLYKNDAEQYFITAIINDRANIVEFLCNAGLNPNDSIPGTLSSIQLAQKLGAVKVLTFFKSQGMTVADAPTSTTKKSEQADPNTNETSVLSRLSYFAATGVDKKDQQSKPDDSVENNLGTL